MTCGEVIAVSISREKGIPKTNVPEAVLVEDWGICGDAHSGCGHRQVSILADESIDKIRSRGLKLSPGAFAENITTRRVDISAINVGDIVVIGSIELEVTQIGKECHSHCAIFEKAGDCVMPREGVFARVRKGGAIRPGDPVSVVTVHRD